MPILVSDDDLEKKWAVRYKLKKLVETLAGEIALAAIPSK
jgi:hypothetical protein